MAKQESTPWDDLEGRLINYKKQHQAKANSDAKLKQRLAQAKTLTEARKVLFGEKKKVYNCGGCNHKACVCTGKRS